MFDYESRVQHWVNRLAFQLRAEATRRLRAEGIDLTAEEWSLLMVLWRDGPTSMIALARRTLRDRTTVTRLVDRLIAKDLVERRPDPEDGRSVVVVSSEKGETQRAPVLAALAPLHTGLTADLDPDDIDATLRVLRALSERLENR